MRMPISSSNVRSQQYTGKHLLRLSSPHFGSLTCRLHRAMSDIEGSPEDICSDGVLLSLPSRPGDFHPEPLTDPGLILSHHPARATARTRKIFAQSELF